MRNILKYVWRIIEISSTICFLVSTFLIVHDIYSNRVDRFVIFSFLFSLFIIITIAIFFQSSFSKIIFRKMKYIFKRIWFDLKHGLREQPYITWFQTREETEPDMKKTWESSKHLVFLGTSQSNLADFFREVLPPNNFSRAYPWETIEIYFANDSLGKVYEPNYRKKVKESRQIIASILTDPERLIHIPNLKKIQFFQHENSIGLFGSFYFLTDDLENPDVIYVIAYHSGFGENQNNSITFKISKEKTEGWNSSHQHTINRYSAYLKTIKDNRKNLGSFKVSLWDKSAVKWSRFCQSTSLMRNEMQGLIESGRPISGLEVLDVGCGSGDMSLMLLEEGVKSLTVLDQSPQMIALSKTKLENYKNVTYALCKIPPESPDSSIDIENEIYDIIVLHQALPALAKNVDELGILVSWCNKYLKSGGKILLAIHNSVIKDLNEKRRAVNDSFKVALETLAYQNEVLKNAMRPTSSECFTLSDIKNVFKEKGFTEIYDKSTTLSMLMEDRIKMWQCLSIIDSFIDIEKVKDTKCIQRLIEQAASYVQGKETRERIVQYLGFQKE